MSDQLLFEVTADDIALLDPEAFDLVWSALGLVIRSRYPWREHVPTAATYLDPDGTITVKLEDGATQSFAAHPDTEDREAGAPATDADDRGTTGAAPATGVATPPGPPNAERIAASRARGALAAGFVKGQKRGPMTEAHKAAIAAGWARRKEPAVATPTAAPTPMVEKSVEPADFAARAKAKASRVWDERVNGVEA